MLIQFSDRKKPLSIANQNARARDFLVTYQEGPKEDEYMTSINEKSQNNHHDFTLNKKQLVINQNNQK